MKQHFYIFILSTNKKINNKKSFFFHPLIKSKTVTTIIIFFVDVENTEMKINKKESSKFYN